MQKDELDFIDWILIEWARSLRSFKPDLGYAISKFIRTSGQIDFDQMCDAADADRNLAVDAIIDGFPKNQRLCLEAVYTGKNDPKSRILRHNAQLLLAAQTEVKNGLEQRGFWVFEKTPKLSTN